MQEQEKISVILPVYNVEPYLEKCVESLLQQTYHNLEIILVDDGSPDRCGEICDELAARDGRIVVIHKKNGGVSSARNAGLDVATGDYVGFVDSDDWVDADMYACLLEAIRRHGADMSCCGFWEHVDGEARPITCSDERVFTGGEVNREIIQLFLRPSSWNKLYHRSLWDDLRYPGIKIGEDQLTTTLVSERAEKIVCLPDMKYHYERREGSADMSRSMTKWLEYYAVSKSWYDKAMETMPEREDVLVASCLYCAERIWCLYGCAPRSERRAVTKELLEVSRFCAPWMPEELERCGMGFLGKITLRMICYPHRWALWVAMMAGKIFRMTHDGPLTLC